MFGFGKWYGLFWALRDFDLWIELGEVFGYFGFNGVGKIMILRLLMGLLRFIMGSAFVCGYDVWVDLVVVCCWVGYLLGEGGIYLRFMGEQHLEFFGSLWGLRYYGCVCELVECFDFDFLCCGGELFCGNW